MKLGSRIFSPRPFTTAVAVVVMIGLVCLGRWQLERAAAKQLMYDAFDKGTDATRVIDAKTPPLARYQHVEARGAYDPSQQILIDNMTDAHGRAGYFVITPFALTTGDWLLVNRGWIPLGSSRATLPPVDVDADTREIRGRADHLPTPGIQLGERTPLAAPFPVVANFPSRAEIERLLPAKSWSSATEVVLLDAGEAGGYVREWQPPGFPPMRNIAYAVQWFGLALALGVIYVVTNLQPSPKAKATA